MQIEISEEELKILREAVTEFMEVRGGTIDNVYEYVQLRYPYQTAQEQNTTTDRVIKRFRIAWKLRYITLQPEDKTP